MLSLVTGWRIPGRGKVSLWRRQKRRGCHPSQSMVGSRLFSNMVLHANGSSFIYLCPQACLWKIEVHLLGRPGGVSGAKWGDPEVLLQPQEQLHQTERHGGQVSSPKKHLLEFFAFCNAERTLIEETLDRLRNLTKIRQIEKKKKKNLPPPCFFAWIFLANCFKKLWDLQELYI